MKLRNQTLTLEGDLMPEAIHLTPGSVDQAGSLDVGRTVRAIGDGVVGNRIGSARLQGLVPGRFERTQDVRRRFVGSGGSGVGRVSAA